MQIKMSAPSVLNIVKRILSSDLFNMLEVPEGKMMKHIVYSDLLKDIVSNDNFDMTLLEPDHVDELQSLILSDEVAKRDLRQVVSNILTEVVRNRVYNFDFTSCDAK